ncbi:MAG: hypothetical protein J6J72_01435, partial [Tyzzerella sp.]|nr:hypothetical protein [Tyzzerella sp.]
KTVRQSLYGKLAKLEEELEVIEIEIAKEKKSQPKSMSIAHVKFFLNALKKGDINDIKYRRLLIDVFVNAIYLYDDRLTLVFNSGDETVTINDKLLSKIEESTNSTKGLFLDKSGPLK